MAIEVFNRTEEKFVVSLPQYKALVQALGSYLACDRYSRDGQFYTISNIYYDTVDDMLIRHSLEKPRYKEKLRLRAYGVPGEGDMVFMEIKKKFKGVVNKRRTEMTLEEAYAFAGCHCLREQKEHINPQVLRELTYAFDLYKPVPKVYIAYDRQAFFSREDASLRITFDRNIRTRRTNLQLEKGDYGRLILPGDMLVMEIKHSGHMPLWLVEELNRLGIKKCSFSKYGTEYQLMLREKLEKEKKYA